MSDNKGGWFRAVRGGKSGFDKLWGYADKLGAPVNKVTNKIGSEAFWPTSIDKESYKAARIIRSFCKDGVYEDEIQQTDDGPKQKQKVIKKIPVEVIKKAQGLAIFTTMRTGLWFSGAGGSGVLVGRMPDGTWSPPSGILLHTAAIGFLVGVDIYDCVLVLNTQEAVNAFAKWRFTLGGEMSAVAGPVGIGGILDTELHTRQAPIFTYLRSRGFYAGVQIDGTVVIERTDENEKYYGYKYSATEIVSGKIRHPPLELKMLSETLRAAQGDVDVDESLLPVEPPPADFEVVQSDHVFGIPDKEDPDPFGVLALEKEGFTIKEAGSQAVASSGEFEFKPNPTSPIFDLHNNRRSFESSSNRNSWRSSSMTVTSTAGRYVTMDTSTQTDFTEPTTPMALTPGGTDNGNPLGISMQTPTSSLQGGVSMSDSATQVTNKKIFPPLPQPNEAPVPAEVIDAVGSVVIDDEGFLDDDDDDDDDDEPVIIQEVHQATRPQMIVKPRVVTVPARVRPDLPTRNPSRMSGGLQTLNIDLPTDREVIAEDQPPTASTTSSSGKGTPLSQEEHPSEGSMTSITPSQNSLAPVPIADDQIGRPSSQQEFKTGSTSIPDFVEINLFKDQKSSVPATPSVQKVAEPEAAQAPRVVGSPKPDVDLLGDSEGSLPTAPTVGQVVKILPQERIKERETLNDQNPSTSLTTTPATPLQLVLPQTVTVVSSQNSEKGIDQNGTVSAKIADKLAISNTPQQPKSTSPPMPETSRVQKSPATSTMVADKTVRLATTQQPKVTGPAKLDSTKAAQSLASATVTTNKSVKSTTPQQPKVTGSAKPVSTKGQQSTKGQHDPASATMTADKPVKPTPRQDSRVESSAKSEFVEINLAKDLSTAAKKLPTTAGTQEPKPVHPSLFPTNPPLVSKPQRTASQIANSAPSSPAIESNLKKATEQGKPRPFSMRMGSPSSSLDSPSADNKADVEKVTGRSPSTRFSLGSSSPRPSFEVIPSDSVLSSSLKENDAPTSRRFSPRRTSMEPVVIPDQGQVEQKTSPISGPRISLASMKLRLDDDSDSD